MSFVFHLIRGHIDGCMKEDSQELLLEKTVVFQMDPFKI